MHLLGGLVASYLFNNRVVAYFHDALCDLDVAKFSHARGDHTGQQTWEALALLVALRLWAPLWKGKRVVITVRSDSVSALSAALNLSSQGANANMLAREMALDIAESLYNPAVLAHIPGVCNVIADVLSRWHEPGKSRLLPAPLRGASLQTPPPRVAAYYRAASPP